MHSAAHGLIPAFALSLAVTFNPPVDTAVARTIWTTNPHSIGLAPHV
jgi:hypothetical protein